MLRPTAVLAALVAISTSLTATDGQAAGRRIIWSEIELQSNDNPTANSKRIWSRESGDEPDFEYWLDESELVSGLNTPGDVAIDVLNDKIYWTDSETRIVGRSDLDGGNAESLFSADESMQGIDVDPGPEIVYFTVFDTGLVRRSNLDGTQIETLIDQGFGATGIALDVPNGKIYYALAGVGEIRRMNLDGTDDELLITTVLPNPRGIDLDLESRLIYWAEDDGAGATPDEPDNSAIYRAGLDGNDVELLVDTGQVAAWGVGVDRLAGEIYWAAPYGLIATCADNGCRGSIWTAGADGSDPRLLFRGAPAPKGLTLEQRYPNCADPGRSKVNLRPQVKFRWNGGDAVELEDFGDPTTVTDYYLCFFDEEAPVPENTSRRDKDAVCTPAPAGDTWSERKNGFRRRAPGRRGITKLDLRAGEEGKARIRLRGKIIEQPTKPFDQQPEFVVQIVNDELECWEGVFEEPSRRNDGARFTDEVKQ